MKKVLIYTVSLLLAASLILSGCNIFEKGGGSDQKKIEKLEEDLSLAIFAKYNELYLSDLKSDQPELLSSSLVGKNIDKSDYRQYYSTMKEDLLKFIASKNIVIYAENYIDGSAFSNTSTTFDLCVYDIKKKEKIKVDSGVLYFIYEPSGHQIFYVKDFRGEYNYSDNSTITRSFYKYNFKESVMLCNDSRHYAGQIMIFDGKKSVLYYDIEKNLLMLCDENNKKSSVFDGNIELYYYSKESDTVYFSSGGSMYKYTVGDKALSIGEHPDGRCVGANRKGEFYYLIPENSDTDSKFSLYYFDGTTKKLDYLTDKSYFLVIDTCTESGVIVDVGLGNARLLYLDNITELENGYNCLLSDDGKRVFQTIIVKTDTGHSSEDIVIYENNNGTLTEIKKIEDVRDYFFTERSRGSGKNESNKRAFLETDNEITDIYTDTKLFDKTGSSHVLKCYSDNSYAFVEHIGNRHIDGYDEENIGDAFVESAVHYRKDNVSKKLFSDPKRILDLEIFSESKVVYLSDHSNNGYGDLYHYNGKEKKLIDEMVTYIFPVKSLVLNHVRNN